MNIVSTIIDEVSDICSLLTVFSNQQRLIKELNIS